MEVLTRNRVLTALDGHDRTAILAKCERVELTARTRLDRVGETTSAMHFPETAVISTIATYSDGTSIEMANIGREACTGIGLILGHPRQLNSNEVQLAGTALKLPVEAFATLRTARPAFEAALFSTVRAVFYQVMVSGACNGAHSTRQRLARWLLTMQDRSDTVVMDLTHGFLAEMLGVRRATVSEAMVTLKGEGLIAYDRGRIQIADPAGLKAASCECYQLVRNAYATLLPENRKY
ncbi:Crp/Fnr family transcriptional regulator [Tranquillimonas rosea]|uniref:Crp/Fnr family transcriptional regulator n=1 Tax=Tranquillimonas rosea TaxID=641238 RepID=UPI003BAC4DE3